MKELFFIIIAFILGYIIGQVRRKEKRDILLIRALNKLMEYETFNELK